MPENRKKQSFLHGALVLTVATALIKVIGALFTIPLANLLGKEGMGYFYTSYDIYSLLLVISTAGLPVALSRMVSEAESLGRHGETKRIFSVGLTTFMIIGAAGSLIMFFFSRPLANLMANPNAWTAVITLSPAVFFVSVMSAYRGFFQGGSNMTPTAVSQIIEALCKLFIGVGLAWLVVGRGLGSELGAAGAIGGVTIGTVLGAMYLIVKRSRDRGLPTPETVMERVPSRMKILKRLLGIAIPVTLGASVLSIINFIDTALVLRRLQEAAGLSYEVANGLYGIYGNAKKIFNFPAAFIVPFAVSIIPAVAAAMARKDRKGAVRTSETAIRITSLLSMPAGIGLIVLSWPILNLVYFAHPDDATVGAPLLSILGIAVIFNCTVLLTNAILQALGKVNLPVVSMAIGGVIKIIANWIMVGTPDINILGAPIGTCLCYGVISLLNLFFIYRIIPDMKGLFPAFVKPLLSAVLMGGVAWGSYTILYRFIGAKLGVIMAIGIAAAVYVVLVVALRAVTKEDLSMLPKGDKIAKFLKIR